MKSPRLTLAAALVLLAVIAIFAASKLPAQTLNPVPQSVVAESIAPPSLWPDAPEPASSSSSSTSSFVASSAFIMPVPTRQPKRNLGAKALGLFAWPGYRMASDSRGEDEQGLKTMLLIERGTAFLDGASTYIMLDTPVLPNAIHATEADPLLTMFGNRNKAAVLATGSFLEVLVNHGSVAIPHIFERKLGPHAGHVARISSILANGTLSMVHIQLGIYNLKNTARLMQSVNAAKANQPTGTQFGN